MNDFSFSDGKLTKGDELLEGGLVGVVRFVDNGRLKSWHGHFESKKISHFNVQGELRIEAGGVNGKVVLTNHNGEICEFQGSGPPV
jgi:LEA14-like dessication related protein